MGFATVKKSTIPPSEPAVGSNRIIFLDELRGLTLISMILYHFMWDLVYIAGISAPWYHSNGAHLWQQSICWTFILLSGFCWSLGHHPIKRGLLVFGCGALVTLVTLLFLPEDAVIFGVLTLIGSAMLLTVPFDLCIRRLTNIAILLLLISISFFIFLLFLPAQSRHLASFPSGLVGGYLLTYLGFPAPGFYSTDYFPILPWFFLYMTGYLLHKLWIGIGYPGAKWMRAGHIPFWAFLGRHCLLIYMLHQPVLYGITLLIMYKTQIEGRIQTCLF